MSPLGRPPAIPELVEEHFDELDWLWEHREANLFTTDWTLADLAELEERAEAHLDGLRLSELHAVDLAVERVGGDESFAATAAALVLLDSGEDALRQVIWTALEGAEPPAVDGIRIALRHRPVPDVALLGRLAETGDPFRAAAAVDILAFHRAPTPALEGLKGSVEPQVRALAFAAAGRTGTFAENDLDAVFQDEEGVLRWTGLLAAARSATRGLLERCRTLSETTGVARREAIAGLGMLGDQADVARLRSLLADDAVAPDAVQALGCLGYVEAVPVLIDLMSDDDLGVHATLAYRRITGAPDVEAEKPFPPPPVEEGEDEEEALPPSPEKARADWEARSSQMNAAPRWHWGVAFPDDRPPQLAALPLDARRNAYLRLRSRFGSRLGDIELEASARRQTREQMSLAGGGA